MPSLTIVSFTQGGLTALMRRFRGNSKAAARTNPSSPALTIEMDALPGIGCIANTPVVRVIDPPSRKRSFAIRASETCPISLLVGAAVCQSALGGEECREFDWNNAVLARRRI